MKKSKVLLSIPSLFLIAVLSVSTLVFAKSNTIKIGLDYEKSGDAASYGLASIEGVKLAADEINKAGGINKQKVALIEKDNHSNNKEAASIAQKLISNDKVAAIIGPATSGGMKAVREITNKYKTPLLSGSSTLDDITIDKNGKVLEYVFKTCFNDSFQGNTMAVFASQNLKLKKAALLIDTSSEYSKELAKYFKQGFVKNGGKIVYEGSFISTAKDYKSVFSKIKAAKPDTIYVPAYYKNVGLIIKQARESGIKLPILGGDGFESDGLSKIAGNSNLNNVYYTTHYNSDSKEAVVINFKKAFNKKYKKNPNTFNALSYDAATLLFDAMKRAKSSDPVKIKDALAKTKNFKAVTGTFTIDKNHNLTKSAVIVKITGTKSTYVTTIQPSTKTSASQSTGPVFDESAVFSQNRLPSLDTNKVILSSENSDSFGKIATPTSQNNSGDSLNNTIPSAPSGVTAVLSSDNAVTVTWKDNSNNETGFDIGVEDSHGDGGTNHVDANTTSWVDTPPHTPGETYFYSISAHNNNGNSAWTDQVSVKIPPKKAVSAPAAASNLKAIMGTDGRIKLTWADNSSDETGFEIECAETIDGASEGGSVKLAANSTSWIDDFPHKSGATYSYRISAYNDIGSSADTNWVNINTNINTAPADVKEGLTATLGTDNKITLEWDYRPEYEDGFEIKIRSSQNTDITTNKIVSNGNYENKWVDNSTHIPGETYFYAIRAYNKIGNSAWTNEVSIKIPETQKVIGALKDSDINLAGIGYLGKGYNIITGSYANVDDQKGIVLDINHLLHDGYIIKVDNNHSEMTFNSGRTVEEYSKKTASSVGVEGGYLCFKASLKTNFSSSSLTNKDNSFATLIYSANLYNLNIDTQDADLSKYLNTAFAKDINQMDPTDLFKKYGTHVLTAIKLGGHLDFSATSSTTSHSESSSMETSMKASFSTMFASAGVSASTSTQNTSSVQISLNNQTTRSFPMYGSKDVTNNEDFKNWIAYLKTNPGLSAFGDYNPLIPIWEFASTKQRQDEIYNAFIKYANGENYIPKETIKAINGITLRKINIDYNRTDFGIPIQYVDPATNDTWYEVANIAAHIENQQGSQLDVLYVRYGTTDIENRPPVVGMFLVNEDQLDDANAIFKKLYDNDPTAQLWGRGANDCNCNGDNNNNDYISSIPGSQHMLLYYVTSKNRDPITKIRVKAYDYKNNLHYYPEPTPLEIAQGHPTYTSVMDMSFGAFGEQNCDEGAVSSIRSLPVDNRHYLEYSTD